MVADKFNLNSHWVDSRLDYNFPFQNSMYIRSVHALKVSSSECVPANNLLHLWALPNGGSWESLFFFFCLLNTKRDGKLCFVTWILSFSVKWANTSRENKEVRLTSLNPSSKQDVAPHQILPVMATLNSNYFTLFPCEIAKISTSFSVS